MEVLPITENNIQDLITERNKRLPPILSSLDDIDHCVKLLEDVKLCTKYLSTYNISDIDQELLQYILPPLKKNLVKLYDDNFLLSDTVDDEDVLNILKENLQVAIEFLSIIKIVFEYLSQNGEINLFQLQNTPVNVAQLILSTFGHCKNSTDAYKQSYNTELVDLFKVTQEVHVMFLKLFEAYIVIQNEVDNTEEIKTLVEDIICAIGGTLSELNLKGMSDNWKGYTAIAQKFSSLLMCTVDLKSPISCLSHEVCKNLSSIENQEEMDIKLMNQIIKITNFFIKVTLKIFDIFWDSLERVSSELLQFCCIVYSFTLDLYRSQGHSTDTLDLIEDSIFKTVEPLLVRLLCHPQTHKILSSENLRVEKYPFGLVNFLNGILRASILNQTKSAELKIAGIINAIFRSSALCLTEFFWESLSSHGMFENLILNISAAVILYDEFYASVENILLQNLLQDHIFAALLAMEVWILLLRNSTSQFCLSTLTTLVQKYRELNFGAFTHRPERIFLKCFIQRVFRILPKSMKDDFVLRYNPMSSMDHWSAIQFRNFPFQHRLSIQAVSMATIEQIEGLRRAKFTFHDNSLIENLGLLSTVNFVEIGLDSTNLANAVYSLWEFNIDNGEISRNNVFKHFQTHLCRITKTLVHEFSSKQLVVILTQLKALSLHDSYKVPIIDFLSTMTNKQFEIAQDNSKISALIIDVACHNLLVRSSNVIRQEILEVLINAKTGTLKSIPREMQGDISKYLRKNTAPIRFDKQYFSFLANLTYRHECVIWRKESGLPRSKKLRLDDQCVPLEGPIYKKEALPVEKAVAKSSKWCKAIPRVENEENMEEGSVSDAIGSIKGEVKCLLRVLKTEKMTAKNASDIRMVANQLLSLL